MARSTLAALISEVRTNIADPAGASQQFSDDELQIALDKRRTEMRWVALQPSPTFAVGGQVLFYDFYSDAKWWESDVVLQDVAYNTITATTAELFVGHWYFATQPNGLAVFATGKTFDMFGSCAELLRKWAASLKLNYRFESAQQRYFFSEQVANMLAIAKEYDAMALPFTSRLVQSDGANEFDGGGLVYPDLASQYGTGR